MFERPHAAAGCLLGENSGLSVHWPPLWGRCLTNRGSRSVFQGNAQGHSDSVSLHPATWQIAWLGIKFRAENLFPLDHRSWSQLRPLRVWRPVRRSSEVALPFPTFIFHSDSADTLAATAVCKLLCFSSGAFLKKYVCKTLFNSNFSFSPLEIHASHMFALESIILKTSFSCFLIFICPMF